MPVRMVSGTDVRRHLPATTRGVVDDYYAPSPTTTATQVWLMARTRVIIRDYYRATSTTMARPAARRPLPRRA